MAVNVLNYISKNTIERMKYEDEILAEIDHQEEINYARAEERQKADREKLETAKSLLDILDIETIVEKFKLTAEETDELKNAN